MGQISDWFCANCLRTIDQLSTHGRCSYCDSDAVDVASRLAIGRLPAKSAAGVALPNTGGSCHRLRRNVLPAAIGAAKAGRIDLQQKVRADAA